MNMGLIDHRLTPLIVAWLEAVNRRAAYSTDEAWDAEMVARDLLNAELGKDRSPWQPIETAPKDGTWILVWEAGINEKYYPAEIARFRSTFWRSSANKIVDAVAWQPAPAGPSRDLLNAALEETK
jgi:hypothetical protein